MSPQQEASASPRVSPQKATPASTRGTSTAFAKPEDDGFEFVRITLRTWEAIASRGHIPASPRDVGTASGEEEDDGFELIQVTIKTWEAIVRGGVFLRQKQRLWGVLGKYLKSIKHSGLQEGLSLADKRRFWGQLGGYLKSKKGTSKIMACPSLSPLT